MALPDFARLPGLRIELARFCNALPGFEMFQGFYEATGPWVLVNRKVDPHQKCYNLFNSAPSLLPSPNLLDSPHEKYISGSRWEPLATSGVPCRSTCSAWSNQDVRAEWVVRKKMNTKEEHAFCSLGR